MSEGDSRVRDSEEAVSTKIRDTQRKAKIEAEDEARDNIKVFSFTSSTPIFPAALSVGRTDCFFDFV